MNRLDLHIREKAITILMLALLLGACSPAAPAGDEMVFSDEEAAPVQEDEELVFEDDEVPPVGEDEPGDDSPDSITLEDEELPSDEWAFINGTYLVEYEAGEISCDTEDGDVLQSFPPADPEEVTMEAIGEFVNVNGFADLGNAPFGSLDYLDIEERAGMEIPVEAIGFYATREVEGEIIYYAFYSTGDPLLDGLDGIIHSVTSECFIYRPFTATLISE